MASLGKLLALVTSPSMWPALIKGVAPTVEHRSALGRRTFDNVIDVGANKGQFAAFALATWPTAKLYCVEPLSGPRARLASVTAGRAEILAFALGETNGSIEMHVASRVDSSSILPLGERQKKVFAMEETSVLEVAIRRLDDAIASDSLTGPILLKIDVQGFERDVLAGAERVLSACDAVYIELSFVELYEGQALAGEIVEILTRAGLSLSGLFNQMYDPEGEALQADFLFLRRNDPAPANSPAS